MPSPSARRSVFSSHTYSGGSSSPPELPQSPHVNLPTSPPPEYRSIDTVSSTSEQDSIRFVDSSDHSSLGKGHGEDGWEEQTGKKKESSSKEWSASEKAAKPKRSPNKPKDSSPVIHIWIIIQQLPERIGWRWFLVWLLVALMIILFAILFPIMWIQSHPVSPGVIFNSTSTSILTVSEQPKTSISTKIAPTVFITTTDSILPTSTSSHTSSTTHSTPQPTRIGGYAAIEYTDNSVGLFWVDDGGELMQLYSVPPDTMDGDPTDYIPTGWTDYGILQGDVQVGSAVVHAYATTQTLDFLAYVDRDYIIRDLKSDQYSDGWFEGTLVELRLKTSQSMNFMVCAPSAIPQDEITYLADIYLFYNSSEGHVKVAQYNGTWNSTEDTPFSASAQYVGCDGDYYGNLVAYVINANRQLEYWFLSKEFGSQWTLVFQHPGPYSPLTTIYSATADQNSVGRSHIFLQNEVGGIIRLDVSGIGSNASVVGNAEIVSSAVLGTRFTYSGDCNRTVTLYYQTNGTSIQQVSMVDDPDNNTVEIVRSQPVTVQNGVPFGSGATGRDGSWREGLLVRLGVTALCALCLMIW